jgi:hypothetical protein
MWIQTLEADAVPRLDLLCDECGVIFEGDRTDDRRTYWRRANVAGWAKVARSPERHVCADC